MKKIFIAILFLSGGAFCSAAGLPVIERPISATNGIESVTVSTSAWTAGWATAYSGCTGMYVTNSSTNTTSMYMTISAAAPTEAITLGPITLAPGSSQFHPISEAVTAYFRSLAASSEDVHILRVKQ